MAAPRIGWEGVPLAVFAGGCALSPLAFGYYDLSIWGWIELGLLVALLALAVAATAVPARRALVATAGLAAVGAWAWLSRGWGESTDAALVEANRWLFYAAALGVLVLLLRDRRHATLLLGATTAGILAIALYVLVRMMASDGGEWFFGGRLNEPLGYVNGQAGFFLLGLWPLLALAERDHPAAPVGVAGVTLLGCVLVLGQSRGSLLAVAVTAVLVLVAVPGRQRRAWAMLVAGGAVAAASGPLLDVYDIVGGRAVEPAGDTLRSAALVSVVATIGAALAWVIAGAVRETAGDRLRRASAWALAAIAALALVGAVANAGRIADRVDTQYDAFVRLDSRPVGNSRFLSGGGNRYDYWRVAAREFGDEPLHGVGAGNYDAGWFSRRRIVEDVRQPHSLALQALAELGLVGGALLAVFVISVLVGLAGLLRAGRDDAWSRAMAVAAGGTFAAWLVHTDVDWLHLLPGVTGLALAAAAVALRPWDGARAVRGGARRAASLAGLGVAVALAGILVARPVWSEHLRTQARDELPRDPAAAVETSGDALALNRDSVPAWHIRAAAYARLGDFPSSRAALLEAIRREPSDWVTWGLLGDLLVRRGERAAAARAYRRALRLNPRDPDLRRLATRSA
jgi:O-Antigen ligase/Tetratricopeptide repeat